MGREPFLSDSVPFQIVISQQQVIRTCLTLDEARRRSTAVTRIGREVHEE